MKLWRNIMEHKGIYKLFILLAGILWGCIGLFVRPLNSKGLSSMEIVSLRAIVTCITMLFFILFYNRKLLVIKLKDIWCFIGTGICSIVFFNYCYFKCISLTTLSIAAILLYTAPAIVMVLSAFLFQERLSRVKVISLILTFAGCVLVTGGFGEAENISLSGILVGLGAGLGYALYSIFSRYALEKGYHSFTITFYTFLIASIGSLMLIDTGKLLGVAGAGTGNMILCSTFGIVCTVLPYLTYTIGLQQVENGQASIIASIEPVTAALLGVLVFGENISLAGAVGVVIVITALTICNMKSLKK